MCQAKEEEEEEGEEQETYLLFVRLECQILDSVYDNYVIIYSQEIMCNYVILSSAHHPAHSPKKEDKEEEKNEENMGLISWTGPTDNDGCPGLVPESSKDLKV